MRERSFIVIARSEALHRMVFRAKRRGDLMRLFHLLRNDIRFNVNFFKAFTIINDGTESLSFSI